VPARSPLADHWRRLGLLEGAPECVIEAAWRWQMAQHHPDRGGSTEVAQAINIARDELKGSGAAANEYVAKHYDAQPWLLLGVERGADRDLARRVGQQLWSALEGTHPRLAARVTWAVEHFGERIGAVTPPPPRVRTAPPPRPRPRPGDASRRPVGPHLPGRPDGMPARVDFGTLAWGDGRTHTVRLTWLGLAPHDLEVEVPPPLRYEVTRSKALRGRVAIALSVDWQSPELRANPAVAGFTVSGRVTLRWNGGDAWTPVSAVLLYPPVVTASPLELDLGAAAAEQDVRASLAVISTAATSVRVTPPAWLAQVDGAGRERSAPVRLAANTPVRVALAVRWPPLLERAQASFAAGRAVRPTGRIVLEWEAGTLEVPVQMVVRPPAR